MSRPEPENFLFIPDAYDCSSGKFYELGSAQPEYTENACVLIPYQDPQKGKIALLFYPVLKETEGDLLDHSEENSSAILLKSRTRKKEYIEKVNALKEHIQRGNIYDINYCIQFYGESIVIDPLTVFKKLQSLAKAPYARLFKSGDEFIISASPELFLKKEGARIHTKPIK